MKQGKKPVSQKPKTVFIQEDELFGNVLDVPPALRAKLKADGKECRWVDYKLLSDMGGYHRRGWTAFKFDKKVDGDTLATQDFLSGSSPDGTFRRGTLVLAVRPIELGDKHRTMLAQRRAIYKNHTKEDASELRNIAREAGLDTQIHEGYDDDKE